MSPLKFSALKLHFHELFYFSFFFFFFFSSLFLFVSFYGQTIDMHRQVTSIRKKKKKQKKTNKKEIYSICFYNFGTKERLILLYKSPRLFHRLAAATLEIVHNFPFPIH